MAVEIIWAQPALIDLRSELRYYGKINKQLAQELTIIIKESIEKIKHMPGIGRTGKRLNTREFVLPKYPYVMACLSCTA